MIVDVLGVLGFVIYLLIILFIYVIYLIFIIYILFYLFFLLLFFWGGVISMHLRSFILTVKVQNGNIFAVITFLGMSVCLFVFFFFFFFFFWGGGGGVNSRCTGGGVNAYVARNK